MFNFAALLQLTHWTSFNAPGPWISSSPMWLTSKRPARVRTAWCSAMIPEYSNGISHPAKLTIFAPRRRWTEFRAVLRNSTVADVFTEGFSFSRRNIERSMRVLECQGRRPPVIFVTPRASALHRCAFAMQANAECKALVAASRMSYYELSDTGAYSTQR